MRKPAFGLVVLLSLVMLLHFYAEAQDQTDALAVHQKELAARPEDDNSPEDNQPNTNNIAAQDADAFKKFVSLYLPYPMSYKDAQTDRISVQYAVIEILKQAGVGYNWKESYKNTDPICRKWVYPNIKKKECRQALKMILSPVGLTYTVKNGAVVLQKSNDSEPSKTKSPIPQILDPPNDNLIHEGIGWKAFHVGATREELIRVFGKPDNDPSEKWLRWNIKHHIDCLIDDDRGAWELRFNDRFNGALTTGIRVGSSEAVIKKAYGEPSHLTEKDNGAKKYEYSERGVLIWTSGGIITQIVVFKPY